MNKQTNEYRGISLFKLHVSMLAKLEYITIVNLTI